MSVNHTSTQTSSSSNHYFRAPKCRQYNQTTHGISFIANSLPRLSRAPECRNTPHEHPRRYRSRARICVYMYRKPNSYNRPAPKAFLSHPNTTANYNNMSEANILINSYLQHHNMTSKCPQSSMGLDVNHHKFK